jgi:hypothetical protein
MSIEIKFKNFCNNLSWQIREKIKWTRGTYLLKNEIKNEHQLFDNDSRELAQNLKTKYQLESLFHHSTTLNYLLNLNRLHQLQTLFDQAKILKNQKIPEDLKVLEVGVKNWETLFSLRQFMGTLSQGDIYGVEVDVYGIYPNFYSRLDTIKSHVKEVGDKNVIFIQGDFNDPNLLPQSIKFSFIFLFFPFLIRQTQVLWGLPDKFFNPDQYVKNVMSKLAAGGFVVLFNQNEEELKNFSDLVEGTKDAQIKLIHQAKLPQLFSPSPHQSENQVGSLWQKI